MRTTKFRAWDNEKGEYDKPVFAAYAGKLHCLLLEFDGSLSEHNMGGLAHESTFPGRYVLEQFTGLLDAKEKEIYENDIVLLGDTTASRERQSVTFHNGCYGWWEGGSFALLSSYTDGGRQYIEVIGNIHQDKL